LELLEVDHLSYHYPVEGQSGHRGIEAISFQVRRGEFVVITGGVGSWKSTLARAMVGLLPKSGGEVRWNGQPVENPGEFFRPPRCAYLSQIPRLFSQSVKENILQGIPEDRLDDLLISRLEMRRLWKGEIG
jgi:ATP-binding cassette subfamily B protein